VYSLAGWSTPLAQTQASPVELPEELWLMLLALCDTRTCLALAHVSHTWRVRALSSAFRSYAIRADRGPWMRGCVVDNPAAFRAVESLLVEGTILWSTADVDSARLQAVLAAMPHLTSLDLTNVRFATRRDVLACIPQTLTRLRLQRIFILEYNPRGAENPEDWAALPAPALHTAELLMICEWLLAWLARTPTLSTLRYLVYTGVDNGLRCDALEQFLAHPECGVTSLELPLGASCGPPEEHLWLTSSSVQRLVLSAPSEAQMSTALWLLTGHMCLPALTHLTLRLACNVVVKPRDILQGFARRKDAVIELERLPMLTQVEVVLKMNTPKAAAFTDKVSVEDLCEQVRVFKSFQDKGILHMYIEHV
jgi:hypothetical protein